jgi:chemotaxis protein CheX
MLSIGVESMRLDFVRIFIDSTAEIFGEVLGPVVEVGAVGMEPGPVAESEMMTIIGLVGEAQGRVVFDMDVVTAIHVAGRMVGEPPPGMTPLVRSSIAELASMAIGRAISRINDEGARLGMSPPTVITGKNLLSYGECFETLVAPLRTVCGEVRLNVMIEDLT